MSDVLLVDDDSELLRSFARALLRHISPLSISTAGTVGEAKTLAQEQRPQVAVVDLCIDEARGVDSGLELIRDLLILDPSIRVVVVTGHGALEYGVMAVAQGAAHFVQKPADPAHVAVLIRDGVVQGSLRREHRRLVEQQQRGELQELCGDSRVMQRLREQLAFLAVSDQPVLICGETGVGKGVCARVLHRSGHRSSGNFVHFQPNFGGGDLVQSQLFGHRKGAFTGATESRRGLVLEAHRGTLFIDELDEVPHATQVALLDVIQEQRIRPVGSDSFEYVDCRFIAATNRPLEESLQSGRVRRDLHHRLAHAVVRVPSLRERREDIPLLAQAFLGAYRERKGMNVFSVAPEVLDILQSHDWPGNVRELQAIIETAAHHAQFKGRTVVVEEDLRVSGLCDGAATRISGASFNELVERFKENLVHESLALHGGNKMRAAEALQLDRGTMRRILARVGAH